jgi:hypothetical protein
MMKVGVVLVVVVVVVVVQDCRPRLPHNLS